MNARPVVRPIFDPSNPEALNFLDEQSMKSLNTQVTGGTTYMAPFSTYLGNTVNMPGNKDINSQESYIFKVINDSSTDDTINMIVDSGIITNLQYVLGPALAGEKISKKDADEGQEKEVNKNAETNSSHDEVIVMSTGKVTLKATTSLGIPQEASQGQQDLVQGLIQQWVNKQGSKDLPPNLASLAARVGVKVTTYDTPSPHQTGHHGQRDKMSPAWEDTSDAPTRRILRGQRFVLSGTWSGVGGGQGLTLGKDNVKAIVERHGGSVTLGFLRLTNAVVIGDNPGQKKILEAHKQGLSIVELDQITSIITNDGKTAQDLLIAPYPEAATEIFTQQNIQVKCPPPTSDPSGHYHAASSSTDKGVQGQDDGMRVGHSNEWCRDTCPGGSSWRHASQ
jgi:hypothetical protein